MSFTTNELTAYNQKLIESTKKVIKSTMAKLPSDPVKIYDPNMKDKNGNPVVSGFEPIKMVKRMIDLDEPDALWNLDEISENVEKYLIPFNLEVVVQMINLYNELIERVKTLEVMLMGAMAALQQNVNSQMEQQSASVNNQLEQQNQQNAANSADLNAQISAINSNLSTMNTNINELYGKINNIEKWINDLDI